MGDLGALWDVIFTWYTEWIKTRDLTAGNFDLHLAIKIWHFKVLRVCIGTHALIIFAHKNVYR